MKLTDWFPPEVKPVRVGVYQRDYQDDFPEIPSYSYWNGEAFCFCEETAIDSDSRDV